VAPYRESGKVSPEFINVRTRDPASSKVPIEGKRWRNRVHTSLGIRHIGIRRLEFQLVDIASSDFPTGRSSDSGGESTLTHIGLRGIAR
jgi:hypothetical protein